jgi:hypothetical protein
MRAEATYAQRAAKRLNALLDEEGFPFDELGRSKAVGARIGIGMQAAQQLLSGLVPWTWGQIDKVCSVFSRTPGYFLDPLPSEPMPSDVQLVPSSDGGESIVWRSPRGFLAHPPTLGTPLRYITMRDRAPRYPLGSLLLYQETGTLEGVRAGAAYVIERDDRLEVMQCQASGETLASFGPIGQQGISVMVPLAPATGGDGQGRIAGSIFAAISPS